MPEKLDSCVEKVMSKGKTKQQAFAICNDSLSKNYDYFKPIPITYKVIPYT